MVATIADFIKDPVETAPYAIDWSSMLADAGLGTGAIVDHVVTVPAGLTLATQSREGALVRAWIGGGQLGARYIVTFDLRLTNPAGSGDPIVWQRSISITVADR